MEDLRGGSVEEYEVTPKPLSHTMDSIREDFPLTFAFPYNYLFRALPCIPWFLYLLFCVIRFSFILFCS